QALPRWRLHRLAGGDVELAHRLHGTDLGGAYDGVERVGQIEPLKVFVQVVGRIGTQTDRDAGVAHHRDGVAHLGHDLTSVRVPFAHDLLGVVEATDPVGERCRDVGSPPSAADATEYRRNQQLRSRCDSDDLAIVQPVGGLKLAVYLLVMPPQHAVEVDEQRG